MLTKFTMPLLAGSLLLSSCATVLTKKNYNFKIIYAQDNTKIVYKDSTYSQPKTIRVKRSKENLVLTAFNDSISRSYEIKPQLNPMFVFMNLTTLVAYPLAPVAYGIDLSNPKRFHYGTMLYVNLDDTSAVVIKPSVGGILDEKRIPAKERLRRYFDKQFTHQGDVYWSVSWPLILYNASFPGAGRKKDAGGLAISTGFEYYYRDNRALGINGGVSQSDGTRQVGLFFSEQTYFPAQRLSSFYIDLYHKHAIKRFSFAYGLTYSFNTWKYGYHQSWGDLEYQYWPEARFTNHSLGVMVSGYYQLNQYLKTGVVYRPTLLRVSPDNSGIYQHTISFDLAVTLRLRKKKH